MSDLSIASTALQQPLWAHRKNLFDQLGEALESGDLDAAKKAFSALQKRGPKGPAPKEGAPSGDNPFAALEKALQAGDLSAAQAAFDQIKKARHQRHHHPADADDAKQPLAITLSSSVSGDTGTNLNLTV